MVYCFWCNNDHHTQNSNHPAALSIISSVNHGEKKVITLSFGCLSNSYILQYDGKKWGFWYSKLQLFERNEWFFQAAHLRKTDDNAVGVIYGDFTMMNMRSTFSSCKCGCAETLSLMQRERFTALQRKISCTWLISLLADVKSPFRVAMTVGIICFV